MTKIEIPPPPEGGWHIVLLTSLPQCCPICGWPFELTPSQKAEFENYKVAFCVNGGHLFQKVTLEAALLAADAVGSDLKNFVKSDPPAGE